MDKTDPAGVHESRQLRVRLASIGKRIDRDRRVSNANSVVENKPNLLKMRDNHHTGWNRVEAVAVRGDARARPRLARQATPGDKGRVAVEGCCAPILCAVRWAEPEVGTQGCSDLGGWVIGVGFEDSGGQFRGD